MLLMIIFTKNIFFYLQPEMNKSIAEPQPRPTENVKKTDINHQNILYCFPSNLDKNLFLHTFIVSLKTLI